MDYEEIKDKYLNKKFLTSYVIIFVILYIFCSFIKFLGQLPILIIIAFLLTYYMNNYTNNSAYNSVYDMNLS
jgi:hypothetical protein